MKLFGYEVRKAAPEKISARPQITPMSPQGPLTVIFQDYVFRKVSGVFYEQLREGIPMIDAAIRRLISLNGTIRIIGDKPDCVAALEDFCLNVPVNDTQKGIHAFLENSSNETFEQGFSLSEFVATKDLKDIEGLRVADSKDIMYRRNAAGVAEPWYRSSSTQTLTPYAMPGTLIDRILNASYGQTVAINGVNELKLDPVNKLYFSINNENTDPYGVSIMRSMEFCAQILATLENSIKNSAERFGDPMYHLHYKAGKSGTSLEDRRKKLEEDFTTIVTAKRAGKSGDIVTAGGPESEVSISSIGHDGQLYTYEIPLRHVLEQLVSKTGLPAWMLGLYWNAAGIKGTVEVECILQDAKIRQLAMLPEFLRLFSIYLRLRGIKFSKIGTTVDKPGDWGLVFETPNIRDEVARAQARFLNAQADMMSSGAYTNTNTNVTLGQATVEIEGMRVPLASRQAGKLASRQANCGCDAIHDSRFTVHGAAKELSRPRPWPELDDVERKYEDELKYDWAELLSNVKTILKLEETKGSRVQGSKGNGEKSEPLNPGTPEPFSFTDEQRRMIMQQLEKFTGYYDWRDTDSAVRWSYGQSYSLGLIQAAKMIGKDRPILDIIKNREIYEELMQTGFERVKDNATRAILDEIIPAMEAQMVSGSNPRHVADTLDKLFGDQNSDWERLARSEMSMAAERAKLDEWKEWDVKQVEFTPAPGACAICEALAGDYDIGSSPVPVEDTHPRCLCSIRPAKSEA